MNLKELFDIFFEVRKTVFWHWKFYVVGVIAIVGWLISRDGGFGWWEQLIGSAVLTGVTALSCIGLILNYRFLDYALDELKSVAKEATFTHPETKLRILKLGSYRWSLVATPMVLLLVLAGLLYVIWCIRFE